MLNQMKVLLSDATLRQQIKDANSVDEAMMLLKHAGAEGSPSGLSQLLHTHQESVDLSESELLSVAGGHPHGVAEPCWSVNHWAINHPLRMMAEGLRASGVGAGIAFGIPGGCMSFRRVYNRPQFFPSDVDTLTWLTHCGGKHL
ncbi:hypothetical protein [Candidatus Entotheonella palauensis]|uniref:hypothetical protein n=1 Tax=Candidatus Entotheonella palauensis TaxID=93172 RepID=UPI000B7DF4FD|nr:hypothetical protein [Candidatus Entotheonella palauensis]